MDIFDSVDDLCSKLDNEESISLSNQVSIRPLQEWKRRIKQHETTEQNDSAMQKLQDIVQKRIVQMNSCENIDNIHWELSHETIYSVVKPLSFQSTSLKEIVSNMNSGLDYTESGSINKDNP
jgi:hypothetical protein